MKLDDPIAVVKLHCTQSQFFSPASTPYPQYVGMLKKIPPPVGESSGPGGIRALALFSAIDEQVGEKGEKAVYYVYYVPKSPDCISISVPELFPDMHRYEARKGDPQAQSTGE
jgi:hypothetical protein